MCPSCRINKYEHLISGMKSTISSLEQKVSELEKKNVTPTNKLPLHNPTPTISTSENYSISNNKPSTASNNNIQEVVATLILLMKKKKRQRDVWI